MNKSYRIEIVKGAWDYWWRIVGRNGQTVMTSEVYSRFADARRAARRFAASMKRNPELEIVEK